MLLMLTGGQEVSKKLKEGYLGKNALNTDGQQINNKTLKSNMKLLIVKKYLKKPCCTPKLPARFVIEPKIFTFARNKNMIIS
jgi:hypothetical protein